MKRLRGCLLVAFIFGCGFAVGGFLGAAFGWVQFFHQITRGGPGALGKVVADRAIHDLKLNGEQQRQIKTILHETGVELDAATAEVRPKVREILVRATDRIRPILNDKQRVKFNAFISASGRKWAPPAAPATPAPASPEKPPEAPVTPDPIEPK